MGRPITRGFRQMDEALKDRAEDLWRRRSS
jgi:hypothetical protein